LAVTIALGGALERVVDPAAVARTEALVLARRDGERDGLIEALGRAPAKLALDRLARLAAQTPHVADRAKIAEALAAHPEGVSQLRKLATDVDGAVRANAIWALGSAGSKAEVNLVRAALADHDVAVAGNAAATLGRLGVRTKAAVADALCAALSDRRSYVRANALAALRLAGERCGAEKTREILRRDRAEVVREAAARLIAGLPEAKARERDRSALEACVAEDPSGRVAAACSEPPPRAASGGEPVMVFVVPMGEAVPVPRAPFALVRADGLVRLGITDRRGAVFEHDAPRGYVSLTVPAPLAR
jgi:HEAT repeat protein